MELLSSTFSDVMDAVILYRLPNRLVNSTFIYLFFVLNGTILPVREVFIKKIAIVVQEGDIKADFGTLALADNFED